MRDLIFGCLFGLGAVLLYYFSTRPESVESQVQQPYLPPQIVQIGPPTQSIRSYSVKQKYERIPLTNRQRFEILKRDGFTCQYCGRKPPEVTLEVDHIFPVDKGGTNDPSNLITSCYDCNRGKSDTLLDSSFENRAVTGAVIER
jgi:5-methylcytosine-specific restriction endonuclease McrA